VFGGGLGRLVGPSRSREPAAADDDVVIGGHTLPQQTEVRSDFSSRSQFTVSRGKYSRPSTRCVVGASARVASFQTTRREPRLRVEVLRLVKELVMTSATTPTMTPSPGLSGIRQFDLAPCAADRMPRVHLDRPAPTPTPRSERLGLDGGQGELETMQSAVVDDLHRAAVPPHQVVDDRQAESDAGSRHRGVVDQTGMWLEYRRRVSVGDAVPPSSTRQATKSPYRFAETRAFRT
jgi:hypothetical protein